MDVTQGTSPSDDTEIDIDVEMTPQNSDVTPGIGGQQNASQNVRLPSYYASTPLVHAPPHDQPLVSNQTEEPLTVETEIDTATVDIDLRQEQATRSNAPSDSQEPVQTDQNTSSLPYPQYSDQGANPAYPPVAVQYPNQTTNSPYAPMGVTETPELFPEQYPSPDAVYPGSVYPPRNGTGSSPTNDTPLISEENRTEGDGEVVSHGRYGLMKLPSYAGGGAFPAEPPPSYEDSNPIPVPQSMAPREPSSAPQPPTAHLISRNFGTTPIYTICPACGEEVQTLTVFVPGALTYLMVCIFLMLGWWFMCCLVPFCVQGFKDVHHVCPSCKKTIGRYDRIGN